MLYTIVQDFQTLFYFARIIALWVCIKKCILWIGGNTIMPFNTLFGMLYFLFLYSDFEALRVSTIFILFIINCLYIISK